MKKLILASGSPRRRELMEALGLRFEVVKADVREVIPAGLEVERVPLYLAELKSNACPVGEDDVIITADTVVILDGEIMGKPRDRSHAISMLEQLSGQVHEVITGVCLRSKGYKKVFSATTKVWFRTLTRDEIEYYVDTFRPYDKAGSYAIQEWIGHAAITKINGSYNNVVGLPTEKLYRYLQRIL